MISKISAILVCVIFKYGRPLAGPLGPASEGLETKPGPESEWLQKQKTSKRF